LIARRFIDPQVVKASPLVAECPLPITLFGSMRNAHHFGLAEGLMLLNFGLAIGLMLLSFGWQKVNAPKLWLAEGLMVITFNL